MVKKKKVVMKKKSVKPRKIDVKIMQKDVNETGITIVAKLNAVKFGIAGGIVCAVGAVFTILCGMTGLFSAYWALASPWISSVYGFLGYSGANITSLILGAIYSFIDGFIGISLFAWIYNKLI